MRIRILTKLHSVSTGEVRRGEPLTFGVPLPRGFTTDVEGWTFSTAAGPPGPVQARVLDRWSDGSVRWALLDVRADVHGSGVTDCSVDCNPDSAASAGTAIAIEQTGDAVVVNTGPARFRLSIGGGF